MFKRFVNWIKSFRTTANGIPDDARWVIYQNQPVLVTPPATNVIVEETRHLDGAQMSRQNWLDEFGEKPAARHARNRAWMIRYLPDECTFM